MPELAEITTPKTAGFVERGSNYSKRKQQMETEEKEIAELEAKIKDLKEKLAALDALINEEKEKNEKDTVAVTKKETK